MFQRERELNIGDKLYYIIKPKKATRMLYSIIYNEIVDIEYDVHNNEYIYIIEHNGNNLRLSCNGYKGKNRICSFHGLFDEIMMTEYEDLADYTAYTDKQDVLDEYRILICTEINHICQKLNFLNENIRDMRNYYYDIWKIPSSAEYFVDNNKSENSESIVMTNCSQNNE